MGCCFLSACSKQKSTNALAVELSQSMEMLPTLVKNVESVEDAKIAAQKISDLADDVLSIAQQVEADEYLSNDQRIKLESGLRDIQAETEYLLTRLAAKPEQVIVLADSLAKLGNSLEVASSVMKQPRQ